MPASSVSALNSWGVYLAASLALVGLLSPALASSVAASREGMDWRSVDGVRAVLSGLSPGVVVTFSFGGSLLSDPIVLRGHSITCSFGRGNVSMSSPWLLSGVTIYPDTRYRAALRSGVVLVTPSV